MKTKFKFLLNNSVYKFITPVFTTDQLNATYNKLMSPISSYIELDRSKTYVQIEMTGKTGSLRELYNGVRGYDDPSDLDYYEEKYTKVWNLPTGTLYYFWIGEENGRTGDPDDYYHVYKFIPKQDDTFNVEYRYIEQKLTATYPIVKNIVFSVMTPGSILSWHTDEWFEARFHHVLDNDRESPSMIFKKPNQNEIKIPAKPGDSYLANVSVPHCVPPVTNRLRIHLLACILGPKFMGKNDNKHSRHGFLMTKNTTWADWEKTL